MIILIDPVSTGPALSAAFQDRGEVPLHLYCSSALRAQFDADPHPLKRFLPGLDEAASVLDQLKPTAVIAASEWGVEPANDLAHRLALPHHVQWLGAARRNKQQMMAALAAAGVPVVASRSVTESTDVDAVVESIQQWPVVVKPVDSAGGDACVVCYDPAEVRAAVAAGLGEANLMGARNTEMTVQDFLDGPQYIVNTVSINGRHLLSDVQAVRVDQVNGRPVMRSSRLLTGLSDEHAELVAYTDRCLDALGIREGAAHTELRSTAHGPRLVEVNARIMGANLDAALYRPALGASQADLVAERFLDPAAFLTRFDTPYAPAMALAMVCLHVPTPGTVVQRPGLDWLAAIPGLHSTERIPEVGARISEPWLCTGQAGMAYFLASDGAELHATVDDLHERENRGELYDIEPLLV